MASVQVNLNAVNDISYFGIAATQAAITMLKKVEESISSWDDGHTYTLVKMPSYYDTIQFTSTDGSEHKYHFHKLLYGPTPAGADFTVRVDTPEFWMKQWGIPYGPFRVVQNLLKNKGIFLVDHTGKGTIPKVYAYRVFPPHEALKTYPWHTNWQIPAVSPSDKVSPWKDKGTLLGSVQGCILMAYLTLPSSVMTSTSTMSIPVVEPVSVPMLTPPSTPTKKESTLEPPPAPKKMSYKEAVEVKPETSNPYRIKVHRRSFDHMSEEFTRVINVDDTHEWSHMVTELEDYLYACKAHNDEYLMCEGKCDNISILSHKDETPSFLCSMNSMPLASWLSHIIEKGPSEFNVVMGSSHHNAPQWFINCDIENKDTAITIVSVRDVPDFERFSAIEHCCDVKEAARFIIHNYMPRDNKVRVIHSTGESELELPSRYSLEDIGERYNYLNSIPLPCKMEFFEEGSRAHVTIEISRTWS